MAFNAQVAALIHCHYIPRCSKQHFQLPQNVPNDRMHLGYAIYRTVFLILTKNSKPKDNCLYFSVRNCYRASL